MGSYNMELPFDDDGELLQLRRPRRTATAPRPASIASRTRPRRTCRSSIRTAFCPRSTQHQRPRRHGRRCAARGDWTIDASLTHGENSFQFNIENSVNASLGTSSPTTFDAGTLIVVGDGRRTSISSASSTPNSCVKSLTLVLGSELRIESYQIDAGDQASGLRRHRHARHAGSRRCPARRCSPGSSRATRSIARAHNVGVYGGLESEIDQGLALDVGGRYENYSDFGSSLIGKVAARAKLVGGAARVRAAREHRLPRAVAAAAVVLERVDAVPRRPTGMLQPTQVLTSNNASPVTKAFGIPKLHEEQLDQRERRPHASARSTTWSFTADGYFIRIDDRIVLTEPVHERATRSSQADPRAVPGRQPGAVLRERGRHRHQGRSTSSPTTRSTPATAR